MLTHGSRAAAIDLLRDVGLLEQILPELAVAGEPNAATHCGRPAADAWLASLAALGLLSEPTFPLALAVLLIPFCDAAGAFEIARRWKLSNQDSRRLRYLVEHQESLVGASQMRWSQLQPLLAGDAAEELIALHAALAGVGDGHQAAASLTDLAYCREKRNLPALELNPPPLVTGDDLLALGIPRGPHYQRLLQAARDAQLDEQIATRQQAIEFVQQRSADSS